MPDYMVLVGMQETLKRGSVEVILFEYSHDTWPRSGNEDATLENAVNLLGK